MPHNGCDAPCTHRRQLRATFDGPGWRGSGMNAARVTMKPLFGHEGEDIKQNFKYLHQRMSVTLHGGA
eukprot:1159827-Pelagomonas_calceolata.AAC.6